MNEKQLENIINMNYRALTLLGMATAIMSEVRNKISDSSCYNIDWFLDAVNDVIYKNQPIPPFPQKTLL